MSDEMPDVIYAVTDVGKTKEGNWEVVDDAWLPAVVPTKYYSESHVEREYVPKAEANGFFIPMDALNEPQIESLRALVKDRKRGGSCDAIVRQDSIERRYEADWVSCIQEVSKDESVPRELVEQLIEASTVKYQCRDEEGRFYMATNDDDISEAIQSIREHLNDNK